MSRKEAIYIVDGLRTPFLKARGKPGPFSAADMAISAGRALLARQGLSPEYINQVILGCVMPSENEANIARIVALRLGCGDHVPAWTVQRNCASGMQAVDSAMQSICLDESELVLAGGVEVMSRAPLIYRPDFVRWMGAFQAKKNLGGRLRMLLALKPQYFMPIISLMCGLTDPVVGLNMGQTAEIIANDFDITRKMMDGFALCSHQRLAQAQDNGYLKEEVVPIYDQEGRCYLEDDGLYRETNMEKMAKLKPYFDKPFGHVTPANSSQITDGAAMLILASEKAVKKYGLKPRARIVDSQWAALDPSRMGLGPVIATTPLLQRNKLKLHEIDYWEINEAFAAQVLACVAAWQDEAFCQDQLGLKSALGMIDMQRLNVDGGSVAIGHPIGASGARILLHLVNILEREKAKRGIATLCVGGGQGGAMLIERNGK